MTRLKKFHWKRLKSVRSANGKSLLHVTAKHGNLAITKFLVKIGCDINLKDKKDYTPLSRALYRGGTKCQKIVEFLIKSKADVSWTNVTVANQKTVIFKDRDIIATFCSALCSREGGSENYKAAANHLLEKGWTLDNIACLKNDSIVSLALNGDLATYYGQLMRAITEQDVIKVKQLLEREASSKRVTSWGLTWAARTEAPITIPIIIKLLLDHGAPVNGFPGDKARPILEALMNHNVYNSMILLDHGAKLGKFKLVYLVAEQCTNQENLHDCVRLLMEHQGVHIMNLIQAMQMDPRTEIWLREDFGIDRLIIQYLTRHYNDTGPIIPIAETKFDCYPFLKTGKCREYLYYYLECSRELQRIKRYKILENVSLSEILDKTIDQIIPLTRNDELMSKIQSESFINQFPNHGKTLLFKVNKALDKRVLIDTSVKVLSKCLPQVGLCDLVLEKIVFYLGVPNALMIL